MPRRPSSCISTLRSRSIASSSTRAGAGIVLCSQEDGARTVLARSATGGSGSASEPALGTVTLLIRARGRTPLAQVASPVHSGVVLRRPVPARGILAPQWKRWTIERGRAPPGAACGQGIFSPVGLAGRPVDQVPVRGSRGMIPKRGTSVRLGYTCTCCAEGPTDGGGVCQGADRRQGRGRGSEGGVAQQAEQKRV